jgi:hypothetical protein
MNGKDKEVFEAWWKEYTSNLSDTPTEWDVHDAWQAACEYKREEYSNIMDAITQTSQYNFKLQAENKKLREALELSLKANLELWEMPDVVHLDDHGEAINIAKEVLKEVKEK